MRRIVAVLTFVIGLMAVLFWTLGPAAAQDPRRPAGRGHPPAAPIATDHVSAPAAAASEDPPPAPSEPEHTAKGGDKNADEDAEDEPVHEPVKMSIGVRFKSLNKLDLALGTYQAEFIVRVACDKEPCKPELTIVNGSGKPEKLEDQKLVKMYKYKADLSALIDTSAMPFDAHLLPLILEDRKNLDVDFEIDHEHSSVDADVKLPGFDLLAGGSATQTEEMGDGLKKEQAHFGILVQRNLFSAFMNYLFPPLIMAIFVMGATLFTKPKAAAGRLAGTAGGLLAVVMFHKGALPPGGVTTLFDKFIIATYCLYVINIIFTVIMMRMEDKKNERGSELAYLVAWG